MNPEDQSFTFEVHSKLITTSQLKRRLESLLPSGTFSIEMRHNMHYVYVNKESTQAPTK